MKSVKERLTNAENWKREAMNTAYVATGLVGAMFVDRGIQWAVEKWMPNYVQHVGYFKAGASLLGGLLLSVSSDEKTPEGDRMRLVGYGVSGAGLISGLRMIPAVDSFLSGTPAPPAVSGVEGLLGLSLGEFGRTENIKEVTTSEAEENEIDLPDLGRERTGVRIEPRYAPSSAEEQWEEVIAEVL